MGIKWRIGVLGVQLVVLLLATAVAVGHPFANEVWFFAGLLAVAVNPQLLEPYYPRPGDVIGNTIIFLFLYAVADKAATHLGWNIAAIGFGVAGALAVYGVISSRRTVEGTRFDFPRAARSISQIASAQFIYSIAFFLSLLDSRPSLDSNFWILAGAWGIVIFVGNINWQRIWTIASASSQICVVETLSGPSLLTVSAPYLPQQGVWVRISSRNHEASGLIVKRITRRNDVWGQIHVDDAALCEGFLSDIQIGVERIEGPETTVVGAVDAGSTDIALQFIATQPLRVGDVVGVKASNEGTCIVYQLVSASIENTDVKGGAHLFERARASQLGVFHAAEHEFRRHPWVPAPGAPVLANLDLLQPVAGDPPSNWELIGHVIGTALPVYLDLTVASTGHVAILGMTKMGKSTLAERLARRFAETRRVTILDLTGEYIGKKGFQRCDNSVDWNSPGVSVFEPKLGEVPAVRALEFLKFLMSKAQPEYQVGQPFPRTVIIDEAHQFIPEPAGLGFGAPGRDQSYEIGLILMQVRKFGISVILISQRTAVVAKSALSQCENLVAFRSVDQTGLDYLEALAGGDVRLMLPRLKQGEALVFGPAVSSELPVAVNVFVPTQPASSQ